MQSTRYTLLGTQPEDIQPPDRMPITLNEKLIMGMNAGAAALGTTLGLIIEGLWYLTSEVATGGLGVAMAGSGAAAALSVASILSLIAAAPIAYITYRELMSEAEKLQADLINETNTRNEHQQKLFFELLRLRCLFNNTPDYNAHITKLLQNAQAEIDVPALLMQIDRVYKKLSEKQYLLEWRFADNLPPEIHASDKNFASQSFIQLMRDANLAANPVVRNRILSDIVDEDLHQHFQPIAQLPVTQRKIAIAYGCIAGLSVAGFGLGAGWAYGAIAIGAGIAAAIPIAGWAALAVSCIVMGVVFGLGVGICKQKNTQRKVLCEQVSARNTILTTAHQTIESARINAVIMKQEIDRRYEPSNRSPGITINFGEVKGFNQHALLSPRLMPRLAPADEKLVVPEIKLAN